MAIQGDQPVTGGFCPFCSNPVAMTLGSRVVDVWGSPPAAPPAALLLLAAALFAASVAPAAALFAASAAALLLLPPPPAPPVALKIMASLLAMLPPDLFLRAKTD